MTGVNCSTRRRRKRQKAWCPPSSCFWWACPCHPSSRLLGLFEAVSLALIPIQNPYPKPQSPRPNPTPQVSTVSKPQALNPKTKAAGHLTAGQMVFHVTVVSLLMILGKMMLLLLGETLRYLELLKSHLWSSRSLKSNSGSATGRRRTCEPDWLFRWACARVVRCGLVVFEGIGEFFNFRVLIARILPTETLLETRNYGPPKCKTPVV